MFILGSGACFSLDFVLKCCGDSGFHFLSTGSVWVPVFPSTYTFIHIKTFSLIAILVLDPTFLSFLPLNVIRTQTWKHEEKVIFARLKPCQQNFELCQTSSDIWISGLKVFLLWFIMNYPSVLWQSRVLDSCHSLIPKKLKKLLFKNRNFFNFPFQLNHYAQVAHRLRNLHDDDTLFWSCCHFRPEVRVEEFKVQ